MQGGEELQNSEDAEKPGKSVGYWLSSLRAAEEAASEHIKKAKRAWEEYLNHGQKTTSVKDIARNVSARYPLYWSSTQVMQPALYSRTPVPVAKKSFSRVRDNIARLSAIGLEDLANYLIRSCPFDRVQYATRDDFLHAGKATCRVFFDADIPKTKIKVYYTQIQDMSQPQEPGMPPTMMWVNAEGEQPEEGLPLLQDEEGYYQESEEETLEAVRSQLLPVYYYDILHSPNARHWDEIDWIAFRANLLKDESKEKFGTKADNLTYAPIGRRVGEDRQGRASKNASPDLYAEVWEIWDKRTKTVCFVSESSPDQYLSGPVEDPYELDGFFPCPPFILGTCGPEDLYPEPDFTQLEPIILQIHGLAARLRELIRASKRKGVYDAGVAELQDLADNTAETEFLGILNFKELLGEGGLEKLVKFFPTQEFVNAAVEMANALQMYEQKYHELRGISDILRGSSDPEETAAAQQLKGKYTSLRFSSVQREFQRLVANSIQLMCDLALKKFPEDKIREIIGVNYWSPEDQQLWPQVLLLLKDDRERKVRIDIETDSTITMNQNEDIEQRNYLAKTVFEGLQAVSGASEQNPLYGAAAMKLLTYVTRGLRYGKDIEEELDQISDSLKQQAQQPPQEEPNFDLQKIQADQQAKQADIQFKLQELEITTELKREELNLEAQKLMADAQLAQVDQQIKAQSEQFNQKILALEMQLETYRVQLDEKEKWLTEMRLQAESKKKEIESIAAQGGSSKGGAVQVHVGAAPRPRKKIGRIIRDENGNAIGIESQEIPDEEVQTASIPGLE